MPSILIDAPKAFAAHKEGAIFVDASWHMASSGRDAREEFITEHLPGAVYFDIDEIADKNSSLPHMLPEPEAFEQAVGALGLSEKAHVIIYDQSPFFSSARVWWMLTAMGHAKCQILDGGLDAWKQSGLPTETGITTPKPATYRARFEPTLLATLVQMHQALNNPQIKIFDSRPAARFKGDASEPRAGLVSGHMPGAVNLPMPALMDNGKLRPRDELRQIFESAGWDETTQAISTCGSGVAACVVAVAATIVFGKTPAVYDGSWTEWAAQKDAPIAIG